MFTEVSRILVIDKHGILLNNILHNFSRFGNLTKWRSHNQPGNNVNTFVPFISNLSDHLHSKSFHISIEHLLHKITHTDQRYNWPPLELWPSGPVPDFGLPWRAAHNPCVVCQIMIKFYGRTAKV